MADEPPKLSIVSSHEIPQKDRQAERCLWHVDWYTRQLAANILRVIRGAGRPEQLVDQVIALRDEMANAPPGITVSEVNEKMAEALSGGIDELDTEHGNAAEEIQRGALRKIAAQLLRQQLQASAGDHDFWKAIQRLDRQREDARRARAKLTSGARKRGRDTSWDDLK